MYEFGSDGIASLCTLLHHDNEKVRVQAVEALGFLEEKDNPAVLQALLNAVHDASPAMRAGVLKELTTYHDPRVREACLAALHDPDAHVRLAARAGLQADETRYYAILRDQLTDPDAEVRDSAAVAMAGFGDASSVDILLDNLKGPTIPMHDASALVRLQEPRAIPLLIRHLHAVNEEQRPAPFDIESEDGIGGRLTGGVMNANSNAAEIIAGYGEKAVEPLLTALHDSSPAIRSGAGLDWANWRSAGNSAAHHRTKRS